eukprot:951894-Rhodomonas_salina.2
MIICLCQTKNREPTTENRLDARAAAPGKVKHSRLAPLRGVEPRQPAPTTLTHLHPEPSRQRGLSRARAAPAQPGRCRGARGWATSPGGAARPWRRAG